MIVKLRLTGVLAIYEVIILKQQLENINQIPFRFLIIQNFFNTYMHILKIVEQL